MNSPAPYFEEDKASEIVFIASGKFLYFYRYNKKRQHLENAFIGNKDHLLHSHEISSLDYNHFFTYESGTLERHTFVFIFSKSGARNLCLELLQSATDELHFRNVTEWFKKGEHFRVISSIGGRIFVGSQLRNILQIHELKVTTSGTYKFLDYQTLGLQNFEYWNSFRAGEEEFVLLKSQKAIHLYHKYEGDYKFFQEIELKLYKYTAVTTVAFPSCGHRVAVLLSVKNEVHIYAQNGEGNAFEMVQTATFDEDIDPEGVTAVVLSSSVYLIIPTANRNDFYEIEWNLLSNAPKDKNNIDQKVLEKSKRIKKEYEWQYSVLSEAFAQLENTIEKKRTVNLQITSDVMFENPVLVSSIKGKVLKDPVQVYRQKLDHMNSDIQEIKQEILKCIEQLRHVVPISGTDRQIEGMKYFYGQKTYISQLVVKHAFIGDTIKDHQQLDETIQNLVRKNDERLIRGVKTFSGRFHVNDLQTLNLNGKEANRLVRLNQSAEIEGARYTKGIKIQDDLLVNEGTKIDRMELAKVFRLNSDRSMDICRFESVNALAGIQVEEDIVNSKPFSQLTESIFSTTGDVFIPHTIVMKNFMIEKDLKAYTIMGVDFDHILNDLVYKNKVETLSSIHFTSPVACVDMMVDKTINREVFPRDFVTRDRNFVSFGSKAFDKINFGELSVTGYVDSLNSSDIVTLSTPQKINGKKTFMKGLKVYGNMNIYSSLVDGVNINLLFMADDESEEKGTTIVFGESVTASGLVTEGLINGMHLETIANDLVYRNEKEVLLSGKKNFLKNLKVRQDARIESVNGIMLETFVNTKNPQMIFARKIFSDKVIFEDIVVHGLIDNTNISDLFSNSLYLNVPMQRVKGEKFFVKMRAPRLIIQKKINRKNVNKFLSKSSNQTLNIDLTVNKAIFSNVNAKAVFVNETGFINGEDFPRNMKLLKKINVLDESVVVTGNVFLKNLKLSTLNSYNMKRLYDLLLLNQRHQQINNNVAFLSLEITGAIKTENKINDDCASNLRTLSQNLMKLNDKNVVHSETEWDEVIVDEMNIGGLINGINLKELDSDSVYLHDRRTYFMKGTKEFLNGLEVLGNLDTNTVNGNDLQSRMLSITTPQTITSPFIFDSIAAETMKLQSFNGKDVNRIKLMENKGDTFIVGPLEFGGLVETVSLEVDSFLNEFHLRSTLQDAVKLDDRKIIITGTKNFAKVPTFENLIVENISNRSLEQFMRIYQNNRRNRTLSSLIVDGNVTATLLRVETISFKGSRSLLAPRRLREEYVVVDSREQHESLIFEHLSVQEEVRSKSVNGLSIPGNLLTRNTGQTIWHPVTVSSVSAVNMSLGGKINGYILPKRLYTVEEKVKLISGSVHFDKNITIQGNLLVRGSVGQKRLSVPDDLVFVNTDSHIKGKVNFTSSLVTTRINSSSKKLNGIPLSSVEANLKSYRNFFNENDSATMATTYAAAVKNIYRKECKRTSYLQTLLLSNLVARKGFELVYIHEFDETYTTEQENGFTTTLTADVSPVVIYQAFGTVWMLTSVHPESCSASIYAWNDDLERFEKNYTLSNVGHVAQWLVIDKNEDSVSLVALSLGSGDCGSTSSSIWRAKQDEYVLHKISYLETGHQVHIEQLGLRSKRIFIESGYQIFAYDYHNGNPTNRKLLPEGRLNFIRWIRRQNGSHVIVRIWNDKYIEISDGPLVMTVPVESSIKDMALLEHDSKIILVLCNMFFSNYQKYFYIYVLKYVDFRLIPIDWFEINTIVKLYPLPVQQSDGAFVASIEEYGTPKIYRLGGEPYMDVAAEFPLVFGQRVWIESFVDVREKFHLIFGDSTKALVVRLKLAGRKYRKTPKDCYI